MLNIDPADQIELTNIARSLSKQRVMFLCGAGTSVETHL